MTNRSASTAQAIDESQRTEQPRESKRRGNERRIDHEEELRRYFVGAYVADAGLRSGFGAQLERARDGLGFAEGGMPDDSPPPCIQLRRQPLEVRVVAGALELVAGQRMADYANLRAFYESRAKGAYWGLLGLEPFAGTAILSTAVRTATLQWMRAQRDEHLEALKAEPVPSDPKGTRAAALKDRLENVAEEVTKRRSRFRWEADDTAEAIKAEERAIKARVRADIGAMSRAVGRAGDPEIIERYWRREPNADELAATLRRACHASRHGRSTADKRAGQALVAEALKQAKANLRRAQDAYADARAVVRKQWRQWPHLQRDARLAAFAQSLELGR